MFGHELTGNMLGPDPHEYVSLAQLSCGPARETIAPATIAPPNLQENMNSVKVRMQRRPSARRVPRAERDPGQCAQGRMFCLSHCLEFCQCECGLEVAVGQSRHGKQHIMTEDIVFIMPCPDESFRVEVCEQVSPRRQAQVLAFRRSHQRGRESPQGRFWCLGYFQCICGL